MKVTKLIVFSLTLTGIGLSYAGDVKLTKDDYFKRYVSSTPFTRLDQYYAQYEEDWNRRHPVKSGVLPFLPASPTPSPMASPILGAASAPAASNMIDWDNMFEGVPASEFLNTSAPAPMLPALAQQNPYFGLYFGEDELFESQRQQEAIRAQKEYQDQYELQEEEANPFTQNRPGFFEDDVAAEPVAPRSLTNIFGEEPTDEDALLLLPEGARAELLASGDNDDEGEGQGTYWTEFADPDQDFGDMSGFGDSKYGEANLFGFDGYKKAPEVDDVFGLGTPVRGSSIPTAAVPGSEVDLLGLGAPAGSYVPPVVASGTRNLLEDSYESTDGADLGFVAATSDRSAGAPFDVSALFAAKDVLPYVSTSGSPAYPVDFSADMGGLDEDDPFAGLSTEPVVVPTLSPDDAQNLPKLEEYLIKQKGFDYARVIDTSLADKLSAAGSSVSSPSVASRVELRSVSPLSAGSLDSTDVDGEEPSKEALAVGSRLSPAVKKISESDIDFGNVVSVERALVDVVGLRYNDVVKDNFTNKVEALRYFIHNQ